MKVQVIQLEAHDDYISTREKMGWAQTGRIVLVWPPRGRILDRKLDLVLLQRQSKDLGVVFAIVTGDSNVIQHADQLGIPVFESVRQALDSPWRGKRRKIIRIQRTRPPFNLELLRDQSPERPENSIASSGVRFGAFGVSLVALLMLVSLFIPRAHLTLQPMKIKQEIKLTVMASPLYSEVNIAGEIPAYFTTTIVQGKDELSTTGSIEIPDQFAISSVSFTNLTQGDIAIPRGTIVSTLGPDPVQFATTKPGEISGDIGHSVTLPVKALIPGNEGNVPSESILAIEGPLGLRLSVINPSPAVNGSQISVPAASHADTTTLYRRLLDQLKNTAMEELRSQLRPGDILLADTLTTDRIIEEVYDPPEDQPADKVELTLQLEFKALILSGSDINNLANQVLDANLPEGYLAIPSTLEYQPIDEPSISNDDLVHWQMILHRDIVAEIDPIHAINLILGLPPEQASMRLSESFELIKPPGITLTPGWWPRMPYLPFQVMVGN